MCKSVNFFDSAAYYTRNKDAYNRGMTDSVATPVFYIFRVDY